MLEMFPLVEIKLGKNERIYLVGKFSFVNSNKLHRMRSALDNLLSGREMEFLAGDLASE